MDPYNSEGLIENFNWKQKTKEWRVAIPYRIDNNSTLDLLKEIFQKVSSLFKQKK